MGANSRLGAYSNKYGIHFVIIILKLVLLLLLLLAITHERPLCVQNIGYISVIYVKYFKFV